MVILLLRLRSGHWLSTKTNRSFILVTKTRFISYLLRVAYLDNDPRFMLVIQGLSVTVRCDQAVMLQLTRFLHMFVPFPSNIGLNL